MDYVKDLDPWEDLKVLIFGRPGSGKTELACTWPGAVLVDTDKGWKTTVNKRFRTLYPEQYDALRVKTFVDDFDDKGRFKKAQAYWDVMSFVNELAEDDSCETIVQDSMTTLQSLAMNVGFELSGQGKKSRSKSLARAHTPGLSPILLPTQADFGSEMRAMEQFLDQAIANIKKKMVFTAHIREDRTSEGILRAIDPYLIGGSIRAKVAFWFDEVWYLEVKNDGKRILNFTPSGVVKATKSRLGLTEPIEDPSYSKIMEAIKKAA